MERWAATLRISTELSKFRTTPSVSRGNGRSDEAEPLVGRDQERETPQVPVIRLDVTGPLPRSSRPLCSRFWAQIGIFGIHPGWSLRLLHQRVAHVGETLAVGCPGVHVHGALAAEQFGHGADGASGARHQPQLHVLVCRVALGAFFERDEDQPLAVGRGVREPVFQVVAGDALGAAVFRTAARGGNAPDVPTSRNGPS